jgi:tetratricopeptide (TPR) repeat protein
MSFLHRVITPLGIAGVLCGLPPAVVLAEYEQPSIAQGEAADFLNRGLQKARQGDYQGAIADYTLAIQSNPNSVEAYLNRGLANHDLGDFNKALADFNQALRINPNNVIALYNRGDAHMDVGDFTSASWQK